jgi:hypothetical protein
MKYRTEILEERKRKIEESFSKEEKVSDRKRALKAQQTVSHSQLIAITISSRKIYID